MFSHLSVCLSLQTCRGAPHPRSGRVEVRMVWRHPIPGEDGGIPHQQEEVPPSLGQDGGYPIPVRTGGTHGTPSQQNGIPYPGPRGGRGYPRVPLSAGWDIPPIKIPGQYTWVPQLKQHGVYLLRGGRYVSCVHAGRLSCSVHNFMLKSTNNL